MTIAQSKITTQGQISIPSEIRRKLGVGPGSVLEWDEENGRIFISRAKRYTTEDIHRALFPDGPPKGPPVDVDEAIRAHMRKKHARR
jgi:AbrB family looped-hinge helix DNA binding protein